MPTSLGGSTHNGLERSCEGWVRGSGPSDGVELLEAWFSGRGFSKHRHDTYGIGVTDVGVQTFEYRGNLERSLPGQVTVLHPDEQHDGRAGTDGGFGYHIVYVAPALIASAVRDILGRPAPLPFVREPVAVDPMLAAVVRAAFRSNLEPLARDAAVVRLAEGLLRSDTSAPTVQPFRPDLPALGRTREFLDRAHGVVSSAELEAVSGLSRYALARQFRGVYGTSPYRYSLLRRLDFARGQLRAGQRLVDVALAAGFADQPHFTRMFKATYGLAPGRYALLHRGVATTAGSYHRR